MLGRSGTSPNAVRPGPEGPDRAESDTIDADRTGQLNAFVCVVVS